MARIKPLSVEELPEDVRKHLRFAEELMGFIPNDVLTLAKWPALLEASKQLVAVAYAPGELDISLKRMIATVVSGAAGCRYCQAHTAHGAVKMAGIHAEKIKKVWEFETNELFTEADRVALRLALAAGAQPNQTTDAHFVALHKHFSERQIMEMMAIISLFGFLNRWNDTLATELEAVPLSFAQKHLQEKDWEPGRHLHKTTL